SRGIGRVDQYGNTSGLGHQVAQKPQPLGRDLSDEEIDTGDVATRPSKAGDKTQLDRVFTHAENDWDCRGRGLWPQAQQGCCRRRRTRSAMSGASRSYWPLSQWYSTVTC